MKKKTLKLERRKVEDYFDGDTFDGYIVYYNSHWLTPMLKEKKDAERVFNAVEKAFKLIGKKKCMVGFGFPFPDKVLESETIEKVKV